MSVIYSIAYTVSLLINISELLILCIFNHDADELVMVRIASVNEEVTWNGLKRQEEKLLPKQQIGGT